MYSEPFTPLTLSTPPYIYYRFRLPFSTAGPGLFYYLLFSLHYLPFIPVCNLALPCILIAPFFTTRAFLQAHAFTFYPPLILLTPQKNPTAAFYDGKHERQRSSVVRWL